MKLIYCFMIFLWPLLSNSQTVRPLSIGDTVPDISLGTIINYSKPMAKFSDFKNKVVVLDFMSTGCVSCIESLPRFDSLQKQYGDKLKIILVIAESEVSVQSFLKRKNIVNLNFTAIAADTILSQLFPHTYISHDVIIMNGVVKAITYPEYITASNLDHLLKNQKISLPVKRDITAFQYDRPLLHLNESIIPDFSYPAHVSYSVVTSYMDNVPWRYNIVRDTINDVIRISFINVPVLALYTDILYDGLLRPAFISLHVSDTSRYAYQPGGELTQEWIRKNTYCYEGSFPLDFSLDSIKRKIVRDLNFYFQLNGSMQKKEVQCLVIVRDNTSGISNPVKKYNAENGKSLQSVVFDLNGHYGAMPVIDESGCGELKLHGISINELIDIPTLRKKLKDYGLKIITAYRTINMFLLEENNPNNF